MRGGQDSETGRKEKAENKEKKIYAG